ncbi:hypothetical protein D9756_000954 [Leucocoprinus leucothites]|uniref:Uncharacterized protein n=1 Tax=Leucocoprinus leucothites TaxID=201217 RepID=A0A8H5LNH3_9AGAR|nr:hypothetical protein D9756_000954 [Leucoagaricus leucothites]
MSLSVDDLVSSFSSSHIGQEAIDLAALHAQLAQTLFTSNARQIPSRNTHTCNTPIARTPSSSFSFSHMPGRSMDDMAMDEDERMVEELLMPSSPVSAPQPFGQGAHQYSSASQQPVSPAHSQAHVSSYFPVSSEPSSSSSASVFASTDPFYLAAMQQQQQQQQMASASFFAQNGRLGQSSPFFARQAQTQHRENHHHPLTIDTSHSIFASTAY